MPPDAVSILMRQIETMRQEMNESFRDLRESVSGYDKHRCESHTDKIHHVSSRQDTYEAAVKALKDEHTERRADSGSRWQSAGVVIALLSALGALVIPFFR